MRHESAGDPACPPSNPKPSVSVVIPVYNSAGILPRLVERLKPVLEASSSSYELIMVNDGSRDGSWDVVEQLAREHRWVRGFDLMRNYGQHNALLCGIRAARYDVIVTMDDDLQHPPEEIPNLLEPLAQGWDVVYGTPVSERHGVFRVLASRVTKLALQNAMGAEIARKVSAFRGFRREVAAAFADYRGPFVSVDVLLTWGTTRFTAVPVRHAPRHGGVSNYTFRKLVTHALNMMTGFSVLPLQLASVMGLGFALFGLVVLMYVVARYLVQGGSVPGFSFLASIIAIFSGAQLLGLGIMGEYLARMHFRMMDRPSYVVRRDTVLKVDKP
ncbi:MAG TPA: glycosyltransferase [Kiritimatiellae bacterium]|nr:glycosyltransferase [Kiritimatiellia bacterium]